MTKMISVAHWEPDRRVLTNVTLGKRRPIFSWWVFPSAALFAAGLLVAEIIEAAVR